MDAWDSEGAIKHTEKPAKTLEWSALPLVDTSSLESTESDTTSSQMALHSGAKKMTGHPPQGTNLASSEQTQECTRSSNGYTEGGVGSISFSLLSNLSSLPRVLGMSSAQDLNPVAVFPLCRPLVWPPREHPTGLSLMFFTLIKDFFF